jgi:hypothetical protein
MIPAVIHFLGTCLFGGAFAAPAAVSAEIKLPPGTSQQREK